LFQVGDVLAKMEELAKVGYWEWDSTPGWVTCSPGVYEIFGLEQIVAPIVDVDMFHSRVHPEDRDRYLTFMHEAETCLESYDIEYRILRADGELRVLREMGKTVFGSTGKPIRLLGIIQDITERKKTEQHLRESEQRYRSLMEQNSSIGIIEVDVSGWIVKANQRFLTITGYAQSEVAHRSYIDFVSVDDLSRVRESYLNALYRDLQEPVDILLVHKSGHSIEVALTISPIVVHGENFGFFAMMKDLTEERHREAALLKTEKLSVVGQLAAGIAHEIRNPLTTLKGFLELIRESSDFTSIERYCGIMSGELNRVESITNELLLLAKPQTVVFQAIDLRVIVQSVVDLLTSQALLHNVEIVAEYGDAALVSGVENQLKQVFLNVMKNAIEAMPEGGRLRIYMHRHEQMAVVTFEDEGCGIPEQRIPRLGEPFYTTKEKGTGLGLMTSYRIVHSHGGSILLSSEIGKGTVVAIELPGSLE